MAINKQANKMTIKVNHDYNLHVGGTLEKIANKMNVEATKGNLELASNKKIVANGNKR